MSDPYAGIATPVAADPYAGIAAPETPAHSAGPDLSRVPADAALRELTRAKAQLTAQISHLPPAAQQVGWQHFNSDPRIAQLKQAAAKPHYGLTELVASKLTMGLTDKITPVVSAAFDMAHGHGFGESYQRHQAEQDQARSDYQDQHKVADWATLPVNLMGGGAGTAAKQTLRQIVKTGAGVGTIAGVGNSRGTLGQQAAQTTVSTLGGAALAPVVGTVLPAAANAGRRGVSRAVSAVTGRAAPAAPPTRSGQILLKTLADQGQTPQEASAMIQEAHSNGVPLALMDTGDETRGLASGLARKPGPSRKLIRDVVVPRQAAQTERVQGAMTRDLGPTANVRTQSEKLIKDAQTAAAPLYEKAYAAPIPDSEKLQALAARPSMRAALKRAYRIAAEEGRDPKVMGFNLDAAGNVTLEKHNSTQTWDYVKRGLDDVIEANRDSTTGRLVLDEAGRATNATKGELLKELDALNPDYAAARQAYAGPAKMATALNKGAKVVNKDAETIAAETRDLTTPELEQYRLGARSAFAKMLEGKTDAADKVAALINTPKKRKVLAQLFGGEEKFNRLLTTLEQEGQTSATHGRINTGSPTASNLADDANVNGLGGVAANAAGRALRGHDPISNLIATLGDLHKYGSGKAGERVIAELAAGVSEADPRALRAAFKAASRAAAANRAGQRGNAALRKVGTLAGGKTASTISSLFAPSQ